jgi:hypothetical protein
VVAVADATAALVAEVGRLLDVTPDAGEGDPLQDLEDRLFAYFDAVAAECTHGRTAHTDAGCKHCPCPATYVGLSVEPRHGGSGGLR